MKIKSKKARALVLFSGGLDSRLVVKLLQEQGIETQLVYFSLPFGCGCCNNLECNFNFSQKTNSKITIIDCFKGILFKKYLKMIKDPKYGYGRGINPCISCRIFMLKEAKKLMSKFSCDFIATGEVLGQRPMSQYKNALINIEKESNLEGKILRPLSARLLEPTKVEAIGLVNREKLMSIHGRTRIAQIELAKKFSMPYPTPAGGCLLCDENYSVRLRDLLKFNKNPTPSEIQSLNGFRHFRNKGRLILGRNLTENLTLQKLNKKMKYNIIISAQNHPGPTALYENKKDKSLAEDLVAAYSNSDLSQREKFENLRIKKTLLPTTH